MKKIFYYIVAFKHNCKKSNSSYLQYAFTTYDEAIKFLVQLHVCSNVTDIHFYQFPQDCLEELEFNSVAYEVK